VFNSRHLLPSVPVDVKSILYTGPTPVAPPTMKLIGIGPIFLNKTSSLPVPVSIGSDALPSVVILASSAIANPAEGGPQTGAAPQRPARNDNHTQVRQIRCPICRISAQALLRYSRNPGRENSSPHQNDSPKVRLADLADLRANGGRANIRFADDPLEAWSGHFERQSTRPSAHQAPCLTKPVLGKSLLLERANRVNPSGSQRWDEARDYGHHNEE
jgi:hypothetical protein